MSLRDKLREYTQREYKTIDVEGIGKIRLQSITEAERVELVNSSQNGHQGQVQARLIAACVVDEDNNRIYCDADIAEIMSLNTRIVQTIAGEIDDLVAPDIEAAKKNSETTRDDSSQSDSPTNSDTPAYL